MMAAVEMPKEVREAIVEFLCSSALADHLGDVRDAESNLWRLLGIKPNWADGDEAGPWRRAKRLLDEAGIPLPEYLR